MSSSINHYYYSCPITSADQFPAENHLWSSQDHYSSIMQPKTSSCSSSPIQKPPIYYSHNASEDEFRNMTSSTTTTHDDTSISKRTKNRHHHHNGGGQDHREDEMLLQKIALFEKALTPSDVGKLNRLVIPKQHAERYFPLNGGGIISSSSIHHDHVVNEKGLLLSFEDNDDEQQQGVVKTWRFRYSYWNSSQSYVLTKGWSRFVKDKKLQAGDIVVFFRHRLDQARLFIGWRRRNSLPPGQEDTDEQQSSTRRSKDVFRYPTTQYYHHQASSLDRPNQPHFTLQTPAAPGSVDDNQQAVAISRGNCRKLRLFGVNLECELAADHQDESSEAASDSTMAVEPEDAAQQYHYYNQFYSNYYNHMDNNLSAGGDHVYRQR